MTQSWRIKLINPGDRFGRWTVLSLSERRQNRCCVYNCRCDCGTEREVKSQSLKSGRSRSCGCLNLELLKKRSWEFGPTKRRREYNIWRGIRQRCLDPNNPSFENYGGRGIKICREWLESFETFCTDMGQAPSGRHSVGRIDNNGDYCKENCRWETFDQQCNNSRWNVFLTHNNKTQTIAQWTKELSLPRGVISSRLRSGWPVDRALSAKVNKNKTHE